MEVMYMNVIETINREYAKMTKSEKALAAYLLSHKSEFENDSITELAARNQVSTPTLIRFARRLGFTGFRDFRKALLESSPIKSTLVNKFESIAHSSENKIMKDTVQQAFSCIEETFSRLDDETSEKAVSLLQTARRVYTFGMKESYALAHYAYTRLYTVRDDTFLLNISNGDLESLLDLRPDDTCLVFLFHRYTKRALDILALLKKIGVHVILVTNDPTDRVNPFAEVVIPCIVSGTGIKNSSIAPICLLDYLCNVLATTDSPKTLERLKHIEGLLKEQSALG